MNDERTLVRCFRKSAPDVFFKWERVRPTVLSQDTNRKLFSKDVGFVGIVVTDRRNAGEQVFDPSPPEPHRFWYRQVFAQQRTIRLINIPRPGFTIRIGTISEPRKEIKFEMVVCVNQSGQYQIAIEIDVYATVCRRRSRRRDYAGDAAVLDFDVASDGCR